MTPARRGAAAHSRRRPPRTSTAPTTPAPMVRPVGPRPCPKTSRPTRSSSPSGGHIRVGTASWTDPTMTARGVFYPDGADTAEERLGLLRQPVPDRRGRRDVLRAAGPADGRAVGRADAARLHLRHQGARADDRSADRGQAAAQGPARGAARRAGRQVADLRQGPARRASATRSGPASRTRSSRWPRPASWARSCSSTRAGSSPARRTATRSRTRRAGCATAGLVGAVEFRSASWFNEKNIERTLRFLGDRAIPLVVVDGPQGFKSSVPPVVAAPSPDLAIVRFHGRRSRDLGGDRRPDRRALPLSVRRDRAGRLGAARPRDRGPGQGHARPVQQLLRELRIDQRPRARAAARGPAGTRPA